MNYNFWCLQTIEKWDCPQNIWGSGCHLWPSLDWLDWKSEQNSPFFHQWFIIFHWKRPLECFLSFGRTIWVSSIFHPYLLNVFQQTPPFFHQWFIIHFIGQPHGKTPSAAIRGSWSTQFSPRLWCGVMKATSATAASKQCSQEKPTKMAMAWPCWIVSFETQITAKKNYGRTMRWCRS